MDCKWVNDSLVVSVLEWSEVQTPARAEICFEMSVSSGPRSQLSYDGLTVSGGSDDEETTG